MFNSFYRDFKFHSTQTTHHFHFCCFMTLGLVKRVWGVEFVSNWGYKWGVLVFDSKLRQVYLVQLIIDAESIVWINYVQVWEFISEYFCRIGNCSARQTVAKHPAECRPTEICRILCLPNAWPKLAKCWPNSGQFSFFENSGF